MKRQLYRLRVTDYVAEALCTLHPNIKRKLRAGFQTIMKDPFAGKALVDELSGLRSYRVSRFRTIYQIVHDKQVEIIAVGPRDRIYEETYRLISKKEKQ